MQADCGLYSSYMNAEKYNLDRIYFGGYFIRGTSSLRRSARGRRACSTRRLASSRLVLSSYRACVLTRPCSLCAGHAATISTLSYAIRFWSKGTKRALFLRHEGFL